MKSLAVESIKPRRYLSWSMEITPSAWMYHIDCSRCNHSISMYFWFCYYISISHSFHYHHSHSLSKSHHQQSDQEGLHGFLSSLSFFSNVFIINPAKYFYSWYRRDKISYFNYYLLIWKAHYMHLFAPNSPSMQNSSFSSLIKPLTSYFFIFFQFLLTFDADLLDIYHDFLLPINKIISYILESQSHLTSFPTINPY